MASDVVIKARTSKRLRDRFARVARDNGRTISEELRRIMERHIADHDAPKEGRP